ncbi:MAG: hypothetical protein K940chlam5_01609 [Candidatus Anoxychlamydiales bacterium]|nr:hypothetical protein [Candidatus Anoxychlamydiales bacterium]
MIETTRPPRYIIESRIDAHLKYKEANHRWLDLFSNEDEDFDVNNFPYIPDVESLATLSRVTFSGSPRLNHFPEVEENSKNTKFVVLMPAKAVFKKERVLNILNIIKNESYGTAAKESNDWVRKNLAVVIALNRPFSIDSEVNDDFSYQVCSEKKVQGIAYSVFGFSWFFKWKSQTPKILKDWAAGFLEEPDLYLKTFNQFLYPVKTAYLLLKSLDQDSAMIVRESLEDRDDKLSKELGEIINMQKIRQKLLTNPATQAYLNNFTTLAPKSPKYLCSLDADAITIRCREDQKGLFEHYDDLIASYLKKRKILPDFLSTGYKAAANENPVLQAAIEIDMEVRSVMTAFFPAYFPEPNMAWLVKNGFKASDFSFMGKAKKDRKLESLRLMQNAINRNLANIDNLVFGKCGHVTTNTERMRTKTIEGKTRVTFSNESDFQSLRSSKVQSHAFPRTWAGQIYNFLNIKGAGGITNVTTPLMGIYSVFHPISLIQDYKSHIFDSWNQSFKDVMNFYIDYARCMVAIYNKPTIRKKPIQDFCNKYKKNSSEAEKQSLEIFLNFEINKMFASKAPLKQILDKQVNADPNILTKVFNVAIFSGHAIFSVLQRYM